MSRSSPVTESDPTASAEWNNGCDFAMVQLCKYLSVDPKSVNWDAATETVDGDVQAVIGNILRAKFGEDWGPGDGVAQGQQDQQMLDDMTLADNVRRRVIEECALVAEGFDAACNSPRMKLFEEAGLVIAVYKRDGEIGAAIRALADTSTDRTAPAQIPDLPGMQGAVQYRRKDGGYGDRWITMAMFDGTLAAESYCSQQRKDDAWPFEYRVIGLPASPDTSADHEPGCQSGDFGPCDCAQSSPVRHTCSSQYKMRELPDPNCPACTPAQSPPVHTREGE